MGRTKPAKPFPTLRDSRDLEKGGSSGPYGEDRMARTTVCKPLVDSIALLITHAIREPTGRNLPHRAPTGSTGELGLAGGGPGGARARCQLDQRVRWLYQWSGAGAGFLFSLFLPQNALFEDVRM
jgi:hypothetical protein